MRIRCSKIFLAVMFAGAIGALPLSAQQSAAPEDPEAPLITAPTDPSRSVPSSDRQYEIPESAGFNSFTTGNTPPPLDNFNPSTLPIVVELFTSQGCSSCPAADKMLSALADSPDVLPLSLHVDYWDYLGWEDSFASPEFTDRQEAYARAAGERSVYTPQLIVDGQDTAVAPGPAQLAGLIDAHRIAPALVSLNRETLQHGDSIEIMPLSELANPVDVVLVSYVPSRTVEIKAGENRGRSMSYVNVVLSLDKLADWDGKTPLRLTIRHEEQPDQNKPKDTRHVILVQEDLGGQEIPGQIIAAIKLD